MEVITSTEVHVNTNCHGISNSLDVSVTDHVTSLPDDIVMDILSRLPVKSLMKFNTVCKHWLFIFKQDPHFLNLHFIRSKSRPNLLYVNPLPEKGGPVYQSHDVTFFGSKTVRQSISCAEMVQRSSDEEQVEAIISKVRIIDDEWFYYRKVLEPVNGLLCFVLDWKTYGVRVYNITTRAATPWVKSTLLTEENDKLIANKSKLKIKPLSAPVYRFGFDPEKKEHNQIKIKELLPSTHCSWKKVYVDGTIYWSNKEYSNSNLWGDDDPDDPNVIIAFDIGSEKYRVIPIPNFILDEPRDKFFRFPIDTLVLGRHVSLLYRMEPHVVKLWMLDDGAGKKVENCVGNRNNWSSDIITLPFCCDNGVGGSGIAGSTDKILFDFRKRLNSMLFTSLYSYDRKKKTCKKIEMDGVSSFNCNSWLSLLTTFTESLFPVSASKQDKN